MSTENVTNVLTIGMDSRKQAIIRMAFKMHTVQRYRLVEDAHGAPPDIAIVDMDCIGAQALWDDFRAKYPNLPAVIATVSPSADAQAPVLTKPIRIDTLFPLLRKTLTSPREQRRSPGTGVGAVAEDAVSVELVVPAVPMASTAAVSLSDPSQVRPLLKPAMSVAAAKPETCTLPESLDRFNPHQGLFSVLGDIRRKCIPSVVSIAGQDAIIVLPSQDSALLIQDEAVIRQACAVLTSTVSVRPLAPTETPSRAVPQNLTALLWQTALWTSQGRLMDGVNSETPIRLRHWPNLTRLAPIPEAMRIAAFWVRFPVNLRLTIKMLNVPAQHVFDFLAATYAIGILDLPQSSEEVVIKLHTAESPPSAEQTKRGGLLARLLRKVVGL
jgi:hypothetical protein